jgi:crotonobetainyl-CoA:carnitine CoA-transferase CaiB-like acyl-CoA transferase
MAASSTPAGKRRVLEFGPGRAAAYCGKLYALWGADVVRIEPPPVGAARADHDPDQHGGRTQDGTPTDQALQLHLHANKRIVPLDYRTDEGRAALFAHIRASDIVVTDESPAMLDALGWQSLAEREGPTALVSITPFGLTGPYRDWQATDASLLALGGYTFLMGDPGRAPLTVPGNYVSYQAGQFAYIGARAAELAATSGTRPRMIDVSMLETVASLSQFTTVMWTYRGKVRSRHGNHWEDIHPISLYPCRDGWFEVNVVPGFWPAFTDILGQPQLRDDPRFATNEARMQHKTELDEIIVAALGHYSVDEILDLGQRRFRVPTGVLRRMSDLLADEHLAARGFWQPIQIEPGKTVLVCASPFRYKDEAPPAQQPAQWLSTGEEIESRVQSTPSDETESRVRSTPSEASESRARSGPSNETESRVRSGARGHAPPDARKAPHAAAPAERPLAGVRVLDLTHVWAGPLATRILGDLGADIVKVEAPSARGQGVIPPRGVGLYPQGDPGAEPWNRQGMFNKLNRNKKSVAIDLKTAAGREILLGLVAECDVVIENFSARTMPKLGLGFDELRRVNPQLIYVAMPGFGTDGPYKDFVAFGPSVEPMTGLTALMGYSVDEPRMTSMALPDACSGVTAAVAMLTALSRRAETGRGGFIDLSLHEAAVALFGEYPIARQLSGEEPRVLGNRHPVHAPCGVYPCAGADDWIQISVCNDAQWQALANLVGEDWTRQSEFANTAGRHAHYDALDARLAQWTAAHGKFALMSALQEAGVAAGAVLDAPELLADAQLTARGYFVELGAAHVPSFPYPGMPLRIDGRAAEGWTAAPRLGEHNATVLGALLGLGPERIAELHADGVLVDRPPAVGRVAAWPA